MKVSFISTVYNEEASIKNLLQSLLNQSQLPDEIIIVDGGSSDRTVAKINSALQNEKLKNKNFRVKFKIWVKKGNRAVGRNEAIKNVSNEIIVCSDAGCVLDKDWVKNITEPFKNPRIDAVAGYYKGDAKTVFEKCLIPYVLVMEDKIDPAEFLPASRSMAFRKMIWKKVGGFPEQFSNNEDYVFASKLKLINAKIMFEKKAVVHWFPRNNIKDAFVMFYRFAKGDAESHIFRLKVFLIFFRYIIALSILFSYLIFKIQLMFNALFLLFIFYVLWSITKNYRYVKDLRAVFFLPFIQFISDVAVLLGTISGFCSKIKLSKLIVIVCALIFSYTLIFSSSKIIRSQFSPPKILDSKIIGFAQYFGYSFSFDYLFLYEILFAPIIIIALLHFTFKAYDKKNQ